MDFTHNFCVLLAAAPTYLDACWCVLAVQTLGCDSWLQGIYSCRDLLYNWSNGESQELPRIKLHMRIYMLLARVADMLPAAGIWRICREVTLVMTLEAPWLGLLAP